MNKQILHSLHSNNFKNISLENGLELKNLNIFIGPNGSGKSNFISALKFLKDCVIPGSENGQSGSHFESAVAQLGGAGLLDRSVNIPAHVQLSYHFSPTDTLAKGLNLFLKLFVGAKDSKVTIGEEYLSSSASSKQTPFYYYRYHDKEIGKGVVSYYDSQERGRRSEYRGRRFENFFYFSIKFLNHNLTPSFCLKKSSQECLNFNC